MSTSNICYSERWTEQEIVRLKQELQIVDNLKRTVSDLIKTSEEMRITYADVLIDVEKLEQSLQYTLSALQVYTDAIQRTDSHAAAAYEAEANKRVAFFA